MPEPSQPSLEELQRWLLAAITQPMGSGVFGVNGFSSGEALAAKDSRPPGVVDPRAVDSLILPTSKQSSTDRLRIYSTAYYLRLVDCLREFFPCLRYAMGDDIFDDFAVAYLEKHPSQSYTLHRLADQFASFLHDSRPTATSAQHHWEEFFVDLARLEHAIEIVFDAEGPEEPSPLGRGQGEGLHSAPPGSEFQPTLVPGFQLLSFHFPVSSYYTAWKNGDKPLLPDPQAQFLALFRRDYIVRRHELTSKQHSLLAELLRGQSLDEAISRTAATALASGASADSLAADLRDWFERWTRAGFFHRAVAAE